MCVLITSVSGLETFSCAYILICNHSSVSLALFPTIAFKHQQYIVNTSNKNWPRAAASFTKILSVQRMETGLISVKN